MAPGKALQKLATSGVIPLRNKDLPALFYFTWCIFPVGGKCCSTAGKFAYPSFKTKFIF